MEAARHRHRRRCGRHSARHPVRTPRRPSDSPRRASALLRNSGGPRAALAVAPRFIRSTRRPIRVGWAWRMWTATVFPTSWPATTGSKRRPVSSCPGICSPSSCGTKQQKSAMLREKLVDLFGTGAQNPGSGARAVPRARLAWFEKPSDPKQLWIEHRLEGSLELNQPNSLQSRTSTVTGASICWSAERGGRGPADRVS